MWRILLDEFIGDLKGQKTRAFLTLLAMVWGTISVVLLLAFGEGLRVAVETGLLNAGERMFMVYGGVTSKVHEGLPKGRPVRLVEADLDILRRAIPEVDLTSPSYGRGGTSLKVGKIRTNTFMEGVYPEFQEMRHMYAAAGGRFINQRDIDQKRRVLFLGNEIAGRLFGTDDPVGRIVMLDNLPFTVIGVMIKKFQSSSNNGGDQNRAIIPASTLRTIYGNRYVNHLLVRPRDALRAPIVKQDIYNVLGRRYKFDGTDDRAIRMWDFFESHKTNRNVGLGIQIFLGLVGVFTLIVAGVGVANIMYVVVKERTREIGIKLAIGAKKIHIMSQFVFEALALSLTGGLVGIAVSALVVAGVNAIATDDNPAMQYIAHPLLSWPIAFTCLGILVGIGLLAGILPARRAANVDPVESLRYE